MSTAGSYEVVCQNCEPRIFERNTIAHIKSHNGLYKCDKCNFHISRLRERAIIAAMNGCLANHDTRIWSTEEIAISATAHADALIERLIR
jgi:hypothetical protein